MSDKRTLEERYSHEPGSFFATVDAFEVPGEPILSSLIRRVCRERTIWPHWLFNGCHYRSRTGHVVLARRLIWRGAYELTDLSIENIAEIFGYSSATVRPYATSWRAFEKSEGATWWQFWGLALADLVGVDLDEAAPRRDVCPTCGSERVERAKYGGWFYCHSCARAGRGPNRETLLGPQLKIKLKEVASG